MYNYSTEHEAVALLDVLLCEADCCKENHYYADSVSSNL